MKSIWKISLLLMMSTLATPKVLCGQVFFNGEDVYEIRRNGLNRKYHYGLKCSGHYHGRCLPFVRHSPTLKGSKKKERIKIKGEKYQRIAIGNSSLLIQIDSLHLFEQLEQSCYRVVVAIPYEDLDHGSTNEWYVEKREELIETIQFFQLSRIVKNHFGTIWIQIPKRAMFTVLCDRNGYEWLLAN